ncbi:UbiA family prenyltransferase [Microbacterium ulmi]|uniref:UbiA family prenyltransferase n=1 Tax=Microbacterium ulmi TaxID=179095 RepID=A0A7Y2M022_9MICO|nr:UbiA family prenyltransferase [Microbacterium ulmi]NII69731.1 4-hydroxybenzoate polyprenyltransferase/phosphoserine phosphatase [Microbacterium ulmi]NNH03294.1 UbiA family prenyltransferase [Microbacterium ulmi]
MPETIAVDLDGTLIRGDLLWEAAIRHTLRTPLGAVRVAWWALKGPVTLKTRLAERVPLTTTLLPYKKEVLDELETRKSNGAELVLATAAASRYAHHVAEHLGIFDSVIATESGGPNQKSSQKAASIQQQQGERPWTYAGDSEADLDVWRASAGAIAVDTTPAVNRRLALLGIPTTHLTTSRVSLGRAWVKQLRVHQWAKNLLVFVPLLTSHELIDGSSLLHSVLAFTAFSLMASAVYIWNDLADLDADRAHPSKRNRPIAAGVIPIPQAAVVGVLLAIGALAIAASVNLLLLVTLIAYVVATNLYSLWLKRKPMIDVTVLALLYTWRLVAGCIAISVVPTVWLLAFSVFFFFGLALIKRYAELYQSGSIGRARGYGRDDSDLVMALGVASNLIAILVFILYLDSSGSFAEYAIPQLLWIAVPLLLYWVARAWLVTIRGEMHDDPLVYAVRSPISLLVIGLLALVWLGATLIGN